MVFSSMTFLWIFLPIVFVLSLVVRNIKVQNIILLIFSLLFYAWGEPAYLLILLASVIMNWGLGLLMESLPEHKKGVLVLSLIGNIGIIGYFKYCNFILGTIDAVLPISLPRYDIALPIGISFFTFQAMSYIIDLYRGQYKAQKSLLNLALYISFFPQLIAGPIVKYKDIEEQILNRNACLEKRATGFRRFIYGLGKKVIISNVLAQVVDTIYGMNLGDISASMAWLAAICYMLEIYYDFSGYSDMAIGLGRMFGFEFLENFNYPYISASIKEFWRRWHISLSSWFRDYLYIPLGGNRKGINRTYLNLIIVFAVTGLWHGASWTFVIWGLYHGFFLIIERMGFGKILDKSRIVGTIYSLFVVIIGWVFFRADDLHFALAFIKRMVLPWRYGPAGAIIGTIVTTKTLIILVIGIIAAGPFQKLFEIKGLDKVSVKWKNSMIEAVYLLAVLFYCILLLANDTYNPFIYFRF
ncbi:alginate O-acetyltransferase complex protein AlgI [Butyrivibrio fibrisolvens DSM 3071]|uniref:Alginate O-acetyltransferase complex protein AlgI n=1 Tax=Butyrivibrio fibrisolvens DSM 3071 TaxID=1121131 RepID=A0A1M6DYA1_BUTFI|nr:MBOAT family O-acyltransferase [Butyrivibrio fibrisolvens]SHI78206.1 alginate O-acetyltransferase complex protein AlgI [Butyrivibrio fibrisolvens DSM 3071]